jgi:pimeloyl-ACP methyl ester carboxylesterase
MEIAPEVRYVVRDGRSIAFQKWGSGARRVVLVNQATTSLDLMWAEGSIHDALVGVADRAECVMYDQLGQGLSDPVLHVPALEERVADLGAVLDAAGFKSATISAIFDACVPVIMFAAQYPERVDSVVLLNPFSQGWLSAAPEELVGWRDAEEVRAYERAWAQVHDHWGRGESLAMQMPSLATRRNLRLWALFERAGASPAMIRSVHEAVTRADVRAVLPLVRAPALVLRDAACR